MDTEEKIIKTADKMIEKTSKFEKKAIKAVDNAKKRFKSR